VLNRCKSVKNLIVKHIKGSYRIENYNNINICALQKATLECKKIAISLKKDDAGENIKCKHFQEENPFFISIPP